MVERDGVFYLSTYVEERIGESILKIFFDPIMYNVEFSDIHDLCGDITERPWGVRLVSSEEDFDHGVIMVEKNLARCIIEDALEGVAKEIRDLFDANPSFRATL